MQRCLLANLSHLPLFFLFGSFRLGSQLFQFLDSLLLLVIILLIVCHGVWRNGRFSKLRIVVVPHSKVCLGRLPTHSCLWLSWWRDTRVSLHLCCRLLDYRWFHLQGPFDNSWVSRCSLLDKCLIPFHFFSCFVYSLLKSLLLVSQCCHFLLLRAIL